MAFIHNVIGFICVHIGAINMIHWHDWFVTNPLVLAVSHLNSSFPLMFESPPLPLWHCLFIFADYEKLPAAGYDPSVTVTMGHISPKLNLLLETIKSFG